VALRKHVTTTLEVRNIVEQLDCHLNVVMMIESLGINLTHVWNSCCYICPSEGTKEKALMLEFQFDSIAGGAQALLGGILQPEGGQQEPMFDWMKERGYSVAGFRLQNTVIALPALC